MPLRADGFEPSAYAIPPPGRTTRPEIVPHRRQPGWAEAAAGGNTGISARMSLVTDDATNPPARRVLVAEDEALIRLDLVELLTEEGA